MILNARGRLKLVLFENAGFLFSDWSLLWINDMENGEKTVWKEWTVLNPIALYSCISLAKVTRNWNDLEQGEPTRENSKTFKSLWKEWRGVVLFVEYSVTVIEAKLEQDSLENISGNKIRRLHQINTKRKLKKRFTPLNWRIPWSVHMVGSEIKLMATTFPSLVLKKFALFVQLLSSPKAAKNRIVIKDDERLKTTWTHLRL